MNKKIKFSSLLKNASNLTDIFDFYKKNFPTKKFLFSKVKDTWSGKTCQEIGINIDKIINDEIKWVKYLLKNKKFRRFKNYI